MNITSYATSQIDANAVVCHVYRDTSERDYGGDSLTQVDIVDVWIFAPESSSQVVVEGNGQETSFTGFAHVDTDTDGDIIHHAEINDELRVAGNEAKRYEVRVKDGLPNEIEPQMWRFGLERANDSS